MERFKIIIADDHPVMLKGLRRLVEKDGRFEVVGEATNSSDLVWLFRRMKPDLAIIDYSMPGDEVYGDGLRLVEYLRRNFPDVLLISFCAILTPVIYASLYDLGVSRVVSKSSSIQEMLAVLGEIRAWRNYDRPYHRRMTDFLRQNSLLKDCGSIGLLTRRECEVLRHFVSGMTVSEIARRLNRSVKTISTQKSSAMRKLGIDNDQQLVRFCSDIHFFE